MGMAHLLGQLSLPQSTTVALPLLNRAALLSSISTPQPAYVYALLLLSEFTQITVPPVLFAPFIPPGSSPTLEARKHLERAAYLHFPAAQYKLGHAYEFAEPPFVFDPLLSVQYYSLASQQGEVEADMALSKWFLCGSGGAAAAAGADLHSGGGFEKDEALALTFAEKAANKGLPAAEFAMGYYAEVGVGQPRDVGKAVYWYNLVSPPDRTTLLTDFFNRPTHIPIPMPLDVLRRSRNPTLNRSRGKNMTPSPRPSWSADAHRRRFVQTRCPLVLHGKARRSPPSARCKRWRAARLAHQVQVRDSLSPLELPEGEGRMAGWLWTLSAKTRSPRGMGPLQLRVEYLRQQHQGGCPCYLNLAHKGRAAKADDDTNGMEPTSSRLLRPTQPPYPLPLSASRARVAVQSHLDV
jgi:hypothetical protein